MEETVGKISAIETLGAARVTVSGAVAAGSC
jgi:hypothetical protein